MAVSNISRATSSNLTDTVEDYEVSAMNTDGPSGEKETEWTNSKWSQYWGYFNSVPDLKAAITSKAQWVVGKGYSSDPRNTVILDHISGWGKDSFQSILFNMEITKRIGGDAFAEIIRDEDGTLLNLKPLDPASIKIVVDDKGIIKRYEQMSKTSTKKQFEKFQPNEIFHLSNNRLADQIHGISDIESLMKTITADEENFDNCIKIMKRQAKPMIMFKLGTDDQNKINAFITKMDTATSKGENIYIPDDINSVNYEVIQVPVNQMSLMWSDLLRKKFYRTIGLPELLPSGGGDATESGGKIGYLAFEQVWSKEQLDLETDIWNQLQIRIKLNPPTSLQQNLQIDQAKAGAMAQMNFQPNDTIAGVGE